MTYARRLGETEEGTIIMHVLLPGQNKCAFCDQAHWSSPYDWYRSTTTTGAKLLREKSGPDWVLCGQPAADLLEVHRS